MSGEAARTVRIALMASIAMSAFIFTSANAQEVPAQAVPPSPPAAQDHAEGGLGDIVVTARRRAESLQDVPVAVTALTAEVLERYDMTSLEKISTQTPQFTIGRASNGSGAQLTLRGIGSSSTSIG
ncbi:MAG: TonB-dependent receptor plug domain-containing protein, partial [Novosphingobium sp.]